MVFCQLKDTVFLSRYGVFGLNIGEDDTAAVDTANKSVDLRAQSLKKNKVNLDDHLR